MEQFFNIRIKNDDIDDLYQNMVSYERTINDLTNELNSDPNIDIFKY